MKKKLLGLALLSAVVVANTAAAQDYDNRWYLSGTAGLLMTDDDREATNAALFGVGIGKRFSPNWSFDVEYTRAEPSWNNDVESAVESLGLVAGDVTIETLEAVGRYHFLNEGRGWDPYVAFGLGAERDSFEFSTFAQPLAGDNSASTDDTGWVARLGAGIESDRRKRADLRLEAGLRYSDAGDFGTTSICDFDECSPISLDIGGNLDFYATASLLVKLGNLPVPVVPVAPTCDTLDGDGDGVNDCNDKCPDSQAGQTVGADGCPVKLTIDLKGVNFDFDKATLRPDAVVILDEAVGVLQKYPELKVEVAGHTDLCGDEGYNQGLSQRRSQTVFDYLTGKGIDAGRLVGPTGYGESRPLEATEQSSPACKSETNRRTELNVQN